MHFLDSHRRRNLQLRLVVYNASSSSKVGDDEETLVGFFQNSCHKHKLATQEKKEKKEGEEANSNQCLNN
jgi:hypothetical protein